MIETIKRDFIFEININNPTALNSFTIPQFVDLANAFKKSDEDRTTSITLLTSTGSFFSAGADIKSVSKMRNQERLSYYNSITSKNIYLVDTILSHKKLIVVALNGPVVGLSAALVNLMDVIWARKGGNPYIYFPFSSIGLVNECGVSASLSSRLGIGMAIDAVCLSRKIELNELIRLGLITKVFDCGEDEFNTIVRAELAKLGSRLDHSAIFKNKALLKKKFKREVTDIIVEESMEGLQCWVEEKPQEAFRKMVLSKRGKL
ncbi:dodecenoyl-CoA isomerase [Martiniozyma asiatica (nom. inval.)]|nr:dodecenoyl-CoA isomerase [Martiniozyma asiatica]